MKKEKWIVDTDPGIDDFFALLYMLKNPSIEIVMISLVSGNSTEKIVKQNALRALCAAKKSVPVYFGSHKPIIKGSDTAEYFHGADGLGGLEISKEFDNHDLSIGEENSVLKMIDEINANPGEINLLIIGPETNIALAYLLDPTIASKIKRKVIMGSSYKSVGNLLPNTEFNFGYDYVAASLVLDKLSNCVICPWEPVGEIVIRPEDIESIVETNDGLDDNLVEFIRGITKTYGEKFGGIELCDFYTIAAMYNEKVVLTYRVAECAAVLDSYEQRGMVYYKKVVEDGAGDFLEKVSEIEKLNNGVHVLMSTFDKAELLKELVKCLKAV